MDNVTLNAERQAAFQKQADIGKKGRVVPTDKARESSLRAAQENMDTLKSELAAGNVKEPKKGQQKRGIKGIFHARSGPLDNVTLNAERQAAFQKQADIGKKGRVVPTDKARESSLRAAQENMDTLKSELAAGNVKEPKKGQQKRGIKGIYHARSR